MAYFSVLRVMKADLVPQKPADRTPLRKTCEHARRKCSAKTGAVTKAARGEGHRDKEGTMPTQITFSL